jgi:hypothetical protein
MGHMAEQNRARQGWRPTCRSCGKRLRKYTMAWWSKMDGGSAPEVGQAHGIHGNVREIVRAKTTAGGEQIVTYWCGGWGYLGNGYFCSQRCGYRWAIHAINQWSGA